MSTTGEREDDKPVVEIHYPTPTLETLELDCGDGVLYDEENPDAWLQTGEDHYLLMDGRWR